MPERNAKVRPITVIDPQIHLLNAGMLTRLYRPTGGMLEALRPGDHLWVREPFVLPKVFDHVSPSQAANMGAAPLFITGKISGHLQPGRPRFARELLRTWHRQHLRVTGISYVRVLDISRQEIAAQGYALPAQFAEAWNRNRSLAKSTRAWSENPTALVLDFERIAAPFTQEKELAHVG